MTAYIGLGANMGNPLDQLQQAIDACSALPSTAITQLSGVYQSPPMGPQDQPDFYNACAALETHLTAHQLLTELQGIERTMGRIKRRHWGERCIDLDLLLYGELVHDCATLTLPHPGLKDRDFVLMPLLDLLEGSVSIGGFGSLDTLIGQCTASTCVKLPHRLLSPLNDLGQRHV